MHVCGDLILHIITEFEILATKYMAKISTSTVYYFSN